VVATRVCEVADPAALRPQLAIDIDREMRDLRARRWGQPQQRVSFDHIVGYAPGVTRACYEITLVEVTPGLRSLEALGQRLRCFCSCDPRSVCGFYVTHRYVRKN